jgi:putative heme iron utilization protein
LLDWCSVWLFTCFEEISFSLASSLLVYSKQKNKKHQNMISYTDPTAVVFFVALLGASTNAFFMPLALTPLSTATRLSSTAISVNGDAAVAKPNDELDIRLNVYEKARTVTSVCTSGTLCTVSAQDGIEGAPFGSFVDYVLDDGGSPIFLMNEMSMHTINIQKAKEQGDALVTLFTQLGGNTNNMGSSFGSGGSSRSKGLQDVSRCSLTGRLERLDRLAPDMDAIRMRYSLTHVYADQVMDSPKFAFYRLVPEKIYFVGGFGVLSTWVDPEDYVMANPDILATEAADICARINRDHAEDLRLTAEHLLEVAPGNPDAIERIRMTSVDRLGMDLRVTAQQGTRRNKLQTDEFRIGFRIPVISVEDAKSEILKVFQEAWEKANDVSWGENEVPGESVPIMKIAADSLE